MKKLEIGTIIKHVSPKEIGISLNGNIQQSKEKDIIHYQIEGCKKKQSKFGYEYLEYKVFDLNNSRYTTLSEMFIYDSLRQEKMEIVSEV